MEIIKETSPHLRRKDTLNGMMIDVLIALSPVIGFALAIYGLDALRNLLVSIATMVLAEFVYVLIKNRLPIDLKKHTFKEKWDNAIKHYSWSNFLVPCVSGVIFALIMPAKTNPEGFIYFALIFGALFGIIIGKLVFGGTGSNIFNPAAVGMVFAKLCFGSKYVLNSSTYYYDVSTSGTALAGGYASTSAYSLLDLLIGKCPGVIGETCKIAILVGCVYLLVRRAADWRVIVSYLGSFLFMMLFAGIILKAGGKTTSIMSFLGYQLLSGGLLFGATYMATDPVTSPVTKPGRVMYGIILGISTVMIRLFGALPEGVAFSILIGNMFTPVIDYYKWSTNKYNWKNITISASLLVIATLIVVWSLTTEVL
jgi:electron transport complex protein RnfD